MKRLTFLILIISSLTLMDFTYSISVNPSKGDPIKPIMSGADLYIKKITVSSKSATILDPPKVFFVIGNQGTERCEASRARLRVKKNDGTVIQERIVKVFALNPGKTFIARLVMAKISKPGSYSFEVVANYNWHADEINYYNNLGGTGKTIKGIPDLIVCIEATPIAYLNNFFWSYVTVKNIGNGHSQPCILQLYVKDKGTQTYTIPILAPNTKHEVSRKNKWWRLRHLNRKKTILAQIDKKGKVKELNEKNNHVYINILVNARGLGLRFDKTGLIRKCSNE